MNTPEFLSLSCAICPDRPAILFEERRLTYAELQERANRLADSLAKLGVMKGERVAILQVNCNEYVETYFATANVGGVFVPLNFRAKQDEIRYMLSHSEASVVFVGGQYVDMVNGIRASLPTARHFISIGVRGRDMLHYEDVLSSGSNEEQDLVNIDDHDANTLMYTSGTTGVPKGVVQPHSAFGSYVLENVDPPSPDQAETNLISMPLYHIAGLQAMLASVYGGRTMALQRQFEPEEWFRIVEQHRVSRVMLVPTMLKKIVDHPDVSSHDLSSIRVVTYGGAACPLDVLMKTIERFPGRTLINAFGTTETSSTIASLSVDDCIIAGTESDEAKQKKLKRLSSSIGKPVAGVEIQIRDDEGGEVSTLAVGEVVARGPRIMTGYWKDEERTRQSFTDDGWYRTGDLGYVDDEGFVYLCGRADDLIVRGGENISPEEVENVLSLHPKVDEVAVIGVPNPEWGQEPRALVVLKKGQDATSEELIEYCRGRLAGFKRPRSVLFLEELPKNAYGKVSRKALREKYGRVEA